MRPAPTLVVSLLVLSVFALVTGAARIFYPATGEILSPVLSLVSVMFIALVVYDAFATVTRKQIVVKRQVPPNLAVGTESRVDLLFENRAGQPVTLEVSDHYPPQLKVDSLPFVLTLAASEAQQCSYSVYPQRRGNADFSSVDVRVRSPLTFWRFRRLLPLPQSVKIFPNFTAISHFELLVHDRAINQMGIHVLQRRGEGLDFHQLREFRAGDALRQVDWKATARQRKPISRQYQEERDQDILFLLDSGRRMHARDGLLSHFDHALNAMLLTAYVALRQGDAVGFMNFANTDQRRFTPVKGKVRLNELLHQVYDLHSTAETSDYLEAATGLMAFHRKRSLVILITNLRIEDFDDLVDAVNLLTRRHLVMVASLRELLLETTIAQTVGDFDAALAYCSTIDYLQQRQNLLFRLKKKGVVIVDAVPSMMHIALVNEYLALKRAGRL